MVKYKIKHTRFHNRKTVDESQWEQICASGESRNWEVLERIDDEDQSTESDAPVYGDLLRQAEEKEKAAKDEADEADATELYTEALDLYTQVYEMKKTKKVEKKLTELSELLGD